MVTKEHIMKLHNAGLFLNEIMDALDFTDERITDGSACDDCPFCDDCSACRECDNVETIDCYSVFKRFIRDETAKQQFLNEGWANNEDVLKFIELLTNGECYSITVKNGKIDKIYQEI